MFHAIWPGHTCRSLSDSRTSLRDRFFVCRARGEFEHTVGFQLSDRAALNGLFRSSPTALGLTQQSPVAVVAGRPEVSAVSLARTPLVGRVGVQTEHREVPVRALHLVIEGRQLGPAAVPGFGTARGAEVRGNVLDRQVRPWSGWDVTRARSTVPPSRETRAKPTRSGAGLSSTEWQRRGAGSFRWTHRSSFRGQRRRA
jgi:hypothetical protein